MHGWPPPRSLSRTPTPQPHPPPAASAAPPRLAPTPQPQPHPEQVRPYGVSKGTALSVILERLCEQHELSEEAEGTSPKVGWG